MNYYKNFQVTKIIFLVVFFASMIAVGLYSRKHATNVNDFVLGGRTVGPWLTAFAYGTSYFSAVVFVGYAGQFGWKYGLASTWIGIGNAIIGSLLAWWVLGKRTRLMTKHLHAKTMPDFFGKRYDSKALRIAASAISFIFLIPYTASLYNGLSRLFGMESKHQFFFCSCCFCEAFIKCNRKNFVVKNNEKYNNNKTFTKQPVRSTDSCSVAGI